MIEFRYYDNIFSFFNNNYIIHCIFDVENKKTGKV